MRRLLPVNIFIILWVCLFCLSVYLEVFLRSAIVQSEQSFKYSLVANSVSSLFLILTGLFSVLPRKLREQVIMSSWLRKHVSVVLHIFQPGLGIWALLLGSFILLYELYWVVQRISLW